MFNVTLTLFRLREISTKNYSDVQRGTDVIRHERDHDKELQRSSSNNSDNNDQRQNDGGVEDSRRTMTTVIAYRKDAQGK